jgi:hypothetical protein
LLRRTIGETTTLNITAAKGPWEIHADPNQFENALLHPAVNARDAVPNGRQPC